MSPGQADAAVIRRHLRALDAAVQRLRHHAGRPLAALGDVAYQQPGKSFALMCYPIRARP